MRFVFVGAHMRSLAVAILLAARAVAAQPSVDFDNPPPLPPPPAPQLPVEHGYLGGGFTLGADQFFNVALVAEGAIALPHLPVWIRGQIATGNSGDFEGGGSYHRFAIGIEGRTCSSAAVCWFGGVDVGYQTQTWREDGPDSMVEDHHGLVIGPRGGLDVGGDAYRLRIGLELFRYDHHSNVSDTEWKGGATIATTLIRRL